MNDDDYLPLSYLNDLLFCERRAALHLNEQIWHDNQFTTEGMFAHKRDITNPDIARSRAGAD